MEYESDTYEVWGRYENEWEMIDCTDTEREANEMLCEYRMSFGSDWKMEIR